ncbi:MAG: hypothetical protein V4710_19380 [Verrucomicrobiota bacterium]
MKSAYELAMERLEQQSPSAKVTDAQKAELAEVDSSFKAKIAEREVFLQDKIVKARGMGDFESAMELEQELAREIRRLNADCESKKNQVRERHAS